MVPSQHLDMSNETMNADASISSHLVDPELEVLQHLAHAEDVRQRDLARIIGMSLGMTNAILKRLALKGLITIRKVNNRNIVYAVSPDGFEEIARRSYRYLKRTIKNVVVYRETIESLVQLIAGQGFEQIDPDWEFTLDRAQIIQYLEGKHPKEANVFQLKLNEPERRLTF